MTGEGETAVDDQPTQGAIYEVVRATVDLPFGMWRGRTAIVDITDPDIQRLLVSSESMDAPLVLVGDDDELVV
jgi:hypothetical protein